MEKILAHLLDAMHTLLHHTQIPHDQKAEVDEKIGAAAMLLAPMLPPAAPEPVAVVLAATPPSPVEVVKAATA